MRLTESQLRSVVRRELQAILKEMHGEQAEEENLAVPVAIAGMLALSPVALRTYLQSHPEAMAHAKELIDSVGTVIDAMQQGIGFE